MKQFYTILYLIPAVLSMMPTSSFGQENDKKTLILELPETYTWTKEHDDDGELWSVRYQGFLGDTPYPDIEIEQTNMLHEHIVLPKLNHQYYGPQTINEYLEQLIPSTLALLITALISVIIGLYLEKFKSRLVFLKYRLLFNSLGTTIQNEFWGNIEVHYRGRKTNHLSFVTIEMTNDSNVDLENVNIDTWVDTDSQILGHDGYYDEAGNFILLEQGYYDYYTQVIQRNQEDIEYRNANPNHITPL